MELAESLGQDTTPLDSGSPATQEARACSVMLS
jgi:hypothetical protein